MQEPRYTVLPLDAHDEAIAAGLSLEEAFARIMALCERQYVFCRTGGVMRLYLTNGSLGEREFESDLPTDMYARRAIKAQVCEHGLGRYRVETHCDPTDFPSVSHQPEAIRANVRF